MSAATPVWELRDIVKRYSGVTANDRVSLKLLPGEIHGLLGENGCGKSTLIKILSGVEQPTAGEILHEGQAIQLRSPVEARRAGVATMFQEFSLVSDLSVAENIFLGRPFTNRIGLVDWARIYRHSAEILQSLGLAHEIDLRAMVGSLSVAEQQLVEIAKAVSIDAKTLILDEPTSALSLGEIERLHSLLRRLKSKGHSILYVSHRLDEVVSLIDVATVLKDGHRVRAPGEVEIAIEPLVAAMIGEELTEHYPPGGYASKIVLFEARGLASNRGVEDVSFKVHAGEILGLAGVMGSGRTSLLRTLFGVEPLRGGTMRLREEPFTPGSSADAIEAGVALIPENRKSDSLFFNFDGAQNTTIAALDQVTRHGLLNHHVERTAFLELAGELDLPVLASLAEFSGGNQQKIVLARWLFRQADLFLLDEPTQGIDVGARASLYQLLRALTRRGKAFVLVSSDFEELLGMSDRIAILRKGRVTEVQSTNAFDECTLAIAVAGNSHRARMALTPGTRIAS
jgi:ribose transport system ATP-binding protein